MGVVPRRDILPPAPGGPGASPRRPGAGHDEARDDLRAGSRAEVLPDVHVQGLLDMPLTLTITLTLTLTQ